MQQDLPTREDEVYEVCWSSEVSVHDTSVKRDEHTEQRSSESALRLYKHAWWNDETNKPVTLEEIHKQKSR